MIPHPVRDEAGGDEHQRQPPPPAPAAGGRDRRLARIARDGPFAVHTITIGRLVKGSRLRRFQLCGVADKRWEPKLHASLKAIPASALEVVSTPPLLEIKGPTTLEVGKTGKWTLTFQPNDTPVGEGSNVNIYDEKNKLLKYQFATIDNDHRTVTAEYRFSQPGVYTIKPYREWNTGFGPYRVTVTGAK